MKYKVGDKVKIVSLQSEGRGCCMDVVGDIGEIIGYDPSSILKYKVKIEDGGRWWWEESNLELVEQRNYREMNPNDLITISVGGIESEVPVGDVVHAVAILGVTNGYHGARIWEALRKPFDTECFVEDMDTVVEFRDKLMKTDYVFGDRVKVLPKIDGYTEYSDRVKDGDTGFVLNNKGSTFPVEVQFVGYSEVFMYEELDFLNSNIEDIRDVCCQNIRGR